MGWFFNTLPDGYIQYTTNNNTYYYSNNVYYQSATQDGQQGYTVVDNPQGTRAHHRSIPAGLRGVRARSL